MSEIELYAIVELFGHQKIAGRISEYQLGGASFVRVDVPETQTQPAFSRMLGAAAIYAINPVTKDVMEHMAGIIGQKPIDAWDIKKMHEKLLQIGSKNEEE